MRLFETQFVYMHIANRHAMQCVTLLNLLAQVNSGSNLHNLKGRSQYLVSYYDVRLLKVYWQVEL
jgi:hypothetical protein